MCYPYRVCFLPFVFACLSFTLAALVRLQYSLQDVYGVMETAKKLRIFPSLAFLNSCIRALADHGDLRGALQVMDRICCLDEMAPDSFSYNSLIYALVQEPWVHQVGPISDLPGVFRSKLIKLSARTVSLSTVCLTPTWFVTCAGLSERVELVTCWSSCALVNVQRHDLDASCDISVV